MARGPADFAIAVANPSRAVILCFTVRRDGSKNLTNRISPAVAMKHGNQHSRRYSSI